MILWFQFARKLLKVHMQHSAHLIKSVIDLICNQLIPTHPCSNFKLQFSRVQYFSQLNCTLYLRWHYIYAPFYLFELYSPKAFSSCLVWIRNRTYSKNWNGYPQLLTKWTNICSAVNFISIDILDSNDPHQLVYKQDRLQCNSYALNS